eukprot:TRINITY_DN16461_c0_g1_i1.p1 TRINITY_DN16461_c0_g1~~TRINITY_DN16461_c0_g1_i1.p1  ORF type:complete len:364 (+),score=23.61 TRINITY_DN16461_c0_g1_i1:49-1140(+)
MDDFITCNRCVAVLGETIGSGQTGVVKICYDREHPNLKFACKTVPLLSHKSHLSNVVAECNALQKVKGHDHVVNLLDFCVDGNGVHLVMDLCQGGTFFDFLRGHPLLEEHKIAFLTRQLLLGLQHCHSVGIIHRDVKPENVLLKTILSPCANDNGCHLCLRTGDQIYNGENLQCLSNVHLKIADFGFATQLTCESGSAKGLFGSPLYMAPEIILDQEYGHEVDMWSVGVICFTALGGLMPFLGHDNLQTFEQILNDKPPFHRGRWPALSGLAKHFVSSLLHRDPKQRLTASAALSHPWMWQNLKYGNKFEMSSSARVAGIQLCVESPAAAPQSPTSSLSLPLTPEGQQDNKSLSHQERSEKGK